MLAFLENVRNPKELKESDRWEGQTKQLGKNTYK